MLVVCPNCAASYQVQASAIGAEGRSVRCVRCRNVWRQLPAAEAAPAPPPTSDEAIAAFQAELGGSATIPDPAETAVPTEAAAPAPPAASPATAPPVEDPGEPKAPDMAATPVEPEPAAQAVAEPVEPPHVSPAPPAEAVAPEADPEPAPEATPENIESIAERRVKRAARHSSRSKAGLMPVVTIFLLAIVAGLIGWRGSIVRHAPQMASLYAAVGLPVNLRGLSFEDIKVSRDTHDGVSVLVVEGNIVSAAQKAVEVPRLRFAMRNETGAEVYAWTAMPAREVLEPGEMLPFRSRLASPPGEGRDVLVRFYTRLDAVSGLR